jgi:purine-binding chemotaxis protein CheW
MALAPAVPECLIENIPAVAGVVPGVSAPTVSLDPVRAILAGREAAGCNELDEAEPDEPLAVVVEEYAEYLSVLVADELYGIDIMRIKEIIRPITITEVPRSPDYLPGVITLRGVIIPVIDMSARLGFNMKADKDKQRIVVIRGDNGYTGLLVDDVIQVVRLGKNDIEPAPSIIDGVESQLVAGLGRNSGRMIIILNLDRTSDIKLS